MDILHLHFPEEYSAKFEPETKMLNFALDISMKYSIVKTLIAWNIQSVFNNILYDAKFVALLLTYVMGNENMRTNNLLKERMRFIRGISKLLLCELLTYWPIQLFFEISATFLLRIKDDQRRAIRFGEYIHQKVAREMEKVGGAKGVDAAW